MKAGVKEIHGGPIKFDHTNMKHKNRTFLSLPNYVKSIKESYQRPEFKGLKKETPEYVLN